MSITTMDNAKPKTENISTRFCGRLGNIILEIFNIFDFCVRNKISFDCIKLNEQYDGDKIGIWNPKTMEKQPIPDYINFCGDILLNSFLKPYFISDENWNMIFGNTKQLEPDVAAKMKNAKNILFLPCRWTPIDSIEKLNLFRKIFEPNPDTVKRLKDQYSHYFCGGHPVYAVHVRRTDYKTFRDGKFLQTKDEILENIRRFSKPESSYVFFSDDIDWCRENIKLENTVFHETQHPVDDLILMSLFTDIISGNSSSYAYVAKLLNKNITILPQWRNYKIPHLKI